MWWVHGKGRCGGGFLECCGYEFMFEGVVGTYEEREEVEGVRE